MQESPFIEFIMQRGIEQGMEQGIEQGIERGLLQANIKNILSVLTVRFPSGDMEPVAEVLESIQDLERLSELLHRAVLTSSVETFLQEISEE